MMDDDFNDLFLRRKAGENCLMCPDRYESDVVIELPSGRVHLQDDTDNPGYCILVFKRHAIELFDLTQEEQAQFIEDVARIGKAIETVCQPMKLNVALLGNMVPHLHCHIKPRYCTDPQWGGTPLFNPPAHSFAPDAFHRLRKRLQEAML